MNRQHSSLYKKTHHRLDRVKIRRCGEMIGSGQRHQGCGRQSTNQTYSSLRKVVLAQHNKRRQSDLGQLFGTQRRTFRAQEARHCEAVIAHARSKSANSPSCPRRRLVVCLEAIYDVPELRAVVAFIRIPNAQNSDSPERGRTPRSSPQQRMSTSREAHRVNLFTTGWTASQYSIRRIFRCRYRANSVPGKRDTNDVAALPFQDVDPSSGPPVVVEGRSDTVDHQNRFMRHRISISETYTVVSIS